MELKIRPWVQDDIPDIVRYWTTLSNADAERMGCDLSRFPSSEEYTRILEEQLQASPERATAFYSMWVVNGDTIGFASLKNIHFGIRGEMHLHIWNADQRGRGTGGRLFCLSAIDFFERFRVSEIICEPGATNPYPNRMLQKIGFPLMGSRVGRSSELSKELPLNTYTITREAAFGYLSKGVEWDASDYARNSQGQFGWAMSNIDKLRLQPSDRVLDVGCGDGKITAELAGRVPEGSVTGVDRSDAMIALARRAVQRPNVVFRVLDAQALDYTEEFDAVFSNSAIHWMPDQLAVVQGIARALRPGGRVFLSMGGRGTAEFPRRVLADLMRKSKWTQQLAATPSPHHFKGPDEYGPWIAQASLRAHRIELVSKPMRLSDVAALEGWLRTTWMTYAERIPESERAEFVREWASRVAKDCALADDSALLMPMVNLEIEAEKIVRKD
jgi:trans-aconitate methyltransferase/RimJ/RimL family protein N-acetyltransferase